MIEVKLEMKLVTVFFAPALVYVLGCLSLLTVILIGGLYNNVSSMRVC